METRSSVKGILHGTTGQPVAGAVVMVTAGPAEFNEIASVTNDSGEFYLSNIMVPGTYTLQINAGNQSHTKRVDVNDGSEVLQVEF